MASESETIKVGLATLGCKVNQCDSAALAHTLRLEGFEPVPFSSSASVYIINTCTVTAYADFQARQLIRRALRENPGARVIVTGCYAQTQARELADIEGVTLVCGNDQKHRIPEILKQTVQNNQRISVGDIFRLTTLPSSHIAGLAGKTRAFFKIQDGCDAYCSYCIVPFARGKSRSLPEEDVLAGIRDFIEQGYREIVLTGIHLGQYGQDLHPSKDLPGVLRSILAQNPQTRFRLSSIEPHEISDELLDLFSMHFNLCPHLHIPLQSGDDEILKMMKRNYDTAFYRGLIDKVTRKVTDIAVGVDVMVGFPGEGEKEFSRTLKLLEDLPVTYLHVFPFSERPGTAAIALNPKVPGRIKKERAALLRELGANKRESFSRRFLERTLPVLVEQNRDKKTGLAKGFSHNYLPVLLDKYSSSLVNTIVPVRIEQVREGKLTGRLLHG